MAESFASNAGTTIGLGISNQLKILQGTSYVPKTYGFEFGNYLAQKSFYNEMSRIQSALVAGEPLKVGNQELSFDNTGDLLGWQQYLQSIESAWRTMDALGKKGLKVQNASLATHR